MFIFIMHMFRHYPKIIVACIFPYMGSVKRIGPLSPELVSYLNKDGRMYDAGTCLINGHMGLMDINILWLILMEINGD